MECVATGRQPLSDLSLAFETIKVNYAGIGRRRRGGGWCCEALKISRLAPRPIYTVSGRVS
jgi:hypothetical protein